MKNYKMVIQYEGTRYNGWQRQGNSKNTIQGVIECALFDITGEKIEIHGSGRTDSGAHALAQVANFWTDLDLDKSFIYKLNKKLPADISILSFSEVHYRFHSRLNAKEKIYQYRLQSYGKPDVFMRRRIYYYDCKLNISDMKKAASYIVGEHDFKSFCSNKRYKKSTVRTIYSINITQKDGEFIFTYRGNGFLYNMVRIITGTIIDVGMGKMNPDEIPKIIECKDRTKAGATMPSQGLTLIKVIY